MSKKKYKGETKERRMIALDADYLIFSCTGGKEVKMSCFTGRRKAKKLGKTSYKEPLKPYKEKLKRLIQEVEDEIAVQMVGQVKGIKAIFSDPNGNFRNDLFSEYKAGREPRSELNKRLQKWAIKKYGYGIGIEADDEVAYLVENENWIGATMDKDLWRGISGDWFNVYHSKRHMTSLSPIEARNFNLIQTITGDSNDNIAGIDGIGEIKAIKLLDKYGWDWSGVVQAYLNADKPDPTDPKKKKRISLGLTIDNAILARRLICMRQSTPKKNRKWKLKLWQPPKEIP